MILKRGFLSPVKSSLESVSNTAQLTDEQKESFAAQVDLLMRAYYTAYYRDELGLRDWKKRMESRLQEAENILPRISDVERWMGQTLGLANKVLIVGGGTGAEFIAFSKKGCETYAIEPSAKGVEIARMKAVLTGVDPLRFIQGVGENLPFEDNCFDFVWCFTVIEHVQCVKSCIQEMIRVVRPMGRIYIATPDYRQIYEAHYKMNLPMFAPKWILKLWLRFKKRPTAFLDTLQRVNTIWLSNVFQENPVVASHILLPLSPLKPDSKFSNRLKRWITRNFGIQTNQHWLLQKQNFS
jgi:SAM-dependent methyltransferase